MRPVLLLSLAAVVAAGCTPTVAETERQQRRAAVAATRLDKALAGLTPGAPQGCLSGIDRRTVRTETHGTTTLFRASGNRVFRNDMNGNCAFAGNDPIVVTQTPTGALCRGDIAQLLDRATRFPIGSCSYGDFIPYTRVK